MGDGRAQHGQARSGPRRNRLPRHDPAGGRRRRRSRQPRSDVPPDQGRPQHRRPLPALRRQAGCRLRQNGHRLRRSVRRTGMDARADRSPPRSRQDERRTDHLFERLRFDPLRSWRADAPARSGRPPRLARAAGQGPRSRDAGHLLGRHRGEPDRDDEGGGEEPRDHQGAQRSLRPRPRFRRPRPAFGDDPAL